MRRPINAAALLLALLPLCGCKGIAAGTLPVIQEILKPYSFHVVGEARGILAVNAKYLAVDAEVDVVIQYRGPQDDVVGNPIVVRWERTFQRGEGKRAYRVVFSSEDKFVDVVKVPWSEARASMPFLPPESPPE